MEAVGKGVTIPETEKALRVCLVKKMVRKLDDRNTFEHQELSSWRRDKKRGDGTQNRLVIWRDSKDNILRNRLFLIGEIISAYFKSSQILV